MKERKKRGRRKEKDRKKEKQERRRQKETNRGKLSSDRLAINTVWLSNVCSNTLHFLHDCL